MNIYDRLATLPPAVQGPNAGYFGAPEHTLDPRLFGLDGSFNDAIRQEILATLYGFWRVRYADAEKWSRVWVAGSAITRQWRKAEALGDLDVLIGLNAALFVQANPSFAGLTEGQIADQLNHELKGELWPRTADFHGFEATFFVNPGGWDIRNIHPYAAYDVTNDEWTVPPVEVPDDWDPHKAFPAEWWGSVGAEYTRAVELRDIIAANIPLANSVAPQAVNARTKLFLAIEEAAALFEAIHLERRRAFASGGKGFMDYYNFRWQAHKYLGTVVVLHQIADAWSDLQKMNQTRAYGAPLASSDEALKQAIMSQRR